ncbi:MAG: RluA family pseudouridine synthase [Pseudomonadota bacterium]
MSEAQDRIGVEVRTVGAPDEGLRLDRWFRAHFPSLGHGALERMLRKGQVRVDGAKAKASQRVSAGQEVRIPPDVPRSAEGSGDPARKAAGVGRISRKEAAETLSAWTIYEDDAILAINKPFGLAVQGGTKTTRHVDALLEALRPDGERPRLVHRLDRDTGGVLLLAKSRRDAAALGRSLQERDVEKTYWALTVRAPRPREGRIDLPIAKRGGEAPDAAGERMEPAQGRDAKKALTDFQTVEQAGQGPAFLALRPITGRTHQLRVHCAAVGAPIVGDGKYGGPEARLEGVARKLHLFCRSMRFRHPRGGGFMELTAPLTGHMAETWAFFGFPNDVELEWPLIDAPRAG